MKCKNCNKELVQIPGKRGKQFCNSTCRSNYWQKSKRSTDNLIKPTLKIIDLTKPTGEIKPHEQPKTNFAINTTTKSENLAKIDELEKELVTVPDNNYFGRQRRKWIENEIRRLKYGY